MEIRKNNLLFFNKLNNSKTNQEQNYATTPFISFMGLKKDVFQPSVSFKSSATDKISSIISNSGPSINFKTIQDVRDLLARERMITVDGVEKLQKGVKGESGYMRVDYNTPFNKDGSIKEDARIKASVGTIKYVINTLGAKNLVLVTHVDDVYKFEKDPGQKIGTLEKKDNKSTLPAAERLQKYLDEAGANIKVKQTDAIDGPQLEEAVKNLGEREVLIIGNIRQNLAEKGVTGYELVSGKEGEADAKYKEIKDPKAQTEFAKDLVKNLKVTFNVNEAPSAWHRNHASFEVGKILQEQGNPSVAGCDFIKELQAYEPILKPKKPLVIVSGGLKTDDKLPAVKALLDNGILGSDEEPKEGEPKDVLIIGGGMANTFYGAKIEKDRRDGKSVEGKSIGDSKSQKDKYEEAIQLMELADKKHVRLVLPQDVIAAKTVIENKTLKVVSPSITCKPDEVPAGYSALDVGEETQKEIRDILSGVKDGTIFYNGPMGASETQGMDKDGKPLDKAFAQGTEAVFEGMRNATVNGSYTMTGGGDTEAAFNDLGHNREDVSFVSKCGGAGLNIIKDLGDLKVLNYLDRKAPPEAAEA